jgi:hypothetical protein
MAIRLIGRGWLERLGSPGMDDKGTPGRRVASGRGMLVGRCEGLKRDAGWLGEWD